MQSCWHVPRSSKLLIDLTCSEDDDEILQNEDLPEVEMGFANTIVVDNLPVVPPEKFEKLGNVIRKIFSLASAIKEGGFWMPVNADTNVWLLFH